MDILILLCAAVILGLAILAALAFAYERGRADLRREILSVWHQHRCRECGAEPRATLIHVTGCAAGWPTAKGPDQFPLPGSES